MNLKFFLRFFDLDHPVKVALFAAEIIPFVGMFYAIWGKRPNIVHDVATGEYRYIWEKLPVLDRILYAAGEFYFSGHLMRAMKHSLFPNAKEKLLLRATNNPSNKRNVQ